MVRTIKKSIRLLETFILGGLPLPFNNIQASCCACINDCASRENELDTDVKRAEKTKNQTQRLLRKRNSYRSKSGKSNVVGCGHTVGTNNNINNRTSRPNIKHNVVSYKTSSRPVSYPRSKYDDHDRPNTIVTLASLKHLSISSSGPKSSPLPVNTGRNWETQGVRKDKIRTMSHANNYGKVSNPARPVGQNQGSNHLSGQQRQGAQGESSSDNNTPQRHGSYTVITPNSTKRNKVLTQASKEAADYASYKESRRVNYVQTTPQAVGGTKSEEEIRKEYERNARNKKYEMIMKRRKWEAEKKAREEAEYREKKERAEEQARRNEQRKRERQGMWTEDHRRTNEAFLRRLEQQKKF